MTDQEKEAVANRLLDEPKARRIRARIERGIETWDETAARRLYDGIPGMPGGHRDRDWQNALDVTSASSRDMGEAVGFELGCWAGSDPIRQFAVMVARGRSSQRVRQFADAHGISPQWVYARIREARKMANLQANALR